MTVSAADISSVTSAIFQRISKNGIRVDVDSMQDAIAQRKQVEKTIQSRVDEEFDYTGLRKACPDAFSKKDTCFNPRSKKHLAAWLGENNIEPPTSFSEEVLVEVFPHEKAELIMEARRARIHISALQGLEKRTGLDERIRPDWVQAATGRWYAKDPQVQTMSRVIREFLVPEEGNAFFILDWKQQELRILAEASQDPVLKSIFEDPDRDPHEETYRRVMRKEMDPENGPRRDKQRSIAKMLNYGMIYGLDARGLGGRLKIPNAEAQMLLDAFFKSYPVMNEWRHFQRNRVREEGGVTTLGGRFIPLDEAEIKKENPRGGESFWRMSVNYYIQGSAADQLQILLERINQHGQSSRNPGLPHMIDLIRCTIHDALLVECRPDSQAVTWFQKMMEIPSLGLPPHPVDIKGPAPNWLAAMEFVEPDPEVIGRT